MSDEQGPLSERDMRQRLWADMSNTPIVPLRSVCQNRNQLPDPRLVESKIQQAVDDGESVAERADIMGVGAENFREKLRALDYVDAQYILRVTKEEYESEYGGMERCPYEETGNKQRCWGCKVPGQILARVMGEAREKRGRTQE